MRKIAAGSLKTNFLALMDEIRAKHEMVLINQAWQAPGHACSSKYRDERDS